MTTLRNCCTASEIGEDGIYGQDPKLRTDGRIKAGSPCMRAGLYQAWMDDATDLFGNPRIDANAHASGRPCVDIGCHQSAFKGFMIVVE